MGTGKAALLLSYRVPEIILMHQDNLTPLLSQRDRLFHLAAVAGEGPARVALGANDEIGCMFDRPSTNRPFATIC